MCQRQMSTFEVGCSPSEPRVALQFNKFISVSE